VDRDAGSRRGSTIANSGGFGLPDCPESLLTMADSRMGRRCGLGRLVGGGGDGGV